MKIKKKVIAVSLSLMIMSCAVSKLSQNDMEGVYIQKSDKGIELHLNSKSFVLKDNFEPTHLAIERFRCCDTIAYGKWELENGMLSLTSPEELSTFYLNVNVTEEFRANKDSIIFIIQNPIEKTQKEKEDKSNGLYYRINIATRNGETVTKTSASNIFNISNLQGIDKIEIEIYPNYDIDIREISARVVYTLPYSVVNAKANVFKIDIPELKYSYLTFKRLNQDYIKIVSKNKLFWDGEEYNKR